MNDTKIPKTTLSTPGSKKSDKIEIVRMLIIATISFLVGFALVYLLLMPSKTSEDELPEPSAPALDKSTSNSDTPSTPSASVYAPDENNAASSNESAALEAGETAVSEGDLPPEIPPGKTPDGVVKDGDAFYLKCWDNDGIEQKGSACDKLDLLEKRFSTRLYAVDKCRREKAGEKAQGKLSVASEVDFQQMKISFWSGASSDLQNATQVGSCLRESLAGLPIHGVNHKFARYRMFYTVLFGATAQKKLDTEAASKKNFASGKGRLVNVLKNKVRVRKAPVDGDIIGKISSDSKVRYLKKKADWCNVVTPNGNQGWMICDALDL